MNTEPPFFLPARKRDTHKGDYGRVLLVGGSRGMAGAIALSAIAALKSGSGLVSAFVPDRCLETVAGFHPGVMTIPGSDDSQGRFAVSAASELSPLIRPLNAIGCGPGMRTPAAAVGIVERLLSANVPRVLDADAINTLATMNWAQGFVDEAGLVLTPHPGEFQRLCGVSARDRPGQIAAAVELSSRTHATIVLKGSETVVIQNSETWSCQAGSPAMATAGSGDVLTGVITGLLGQKVASCGADRTASQMISVWDAARLGVWIHGRAGSLAAEQFGEAGVTCWEILNAIPTATAMAVSPKIDS